MCCSLLPLVALLRRTELERVSKYCKLDKVYETDVLGEKWPWAAVRLQNVLDSATQSNIIVVLERMGGRNEGARAQDGHLYILIVGSQLSWNRKPVSKTIPTPY